jgi:hypothetical protein
MMQLLTGQDARSVITTVEAALKRSLSDPASFAAVIDPRAGAWPLVEAASFAHLAARCAALQRTDRPELRSEVLPGLIQLAERAKSYATTAAALAANPTFRRLASMNTGASAASVEPPSMFVCPITQEVMADPVFASDGFTYEREAIEGWIANHNTSPMTNLPLPHPHLTANLALRSSVKEWCDQHPAYMQAAGLRI